MYMDKQIVDKLIKFGLITNIGVDAEKYKDIDDLIAKGIITVPGAKDKINELLGEIADVTPETIEDENDDNTQVLYFKNAVATFSAFGAPDEVVTF